MNNQKTSNIHIHKKDLVLLKSLNIIKVFRVLILQKKIQIGQKLPTRHL